MLISIDYWGTLYDHKGSKKMRMDIVNKFIKRYLLEHNISPNKNIDDIFYAMSQYISHQHNNNSFPSDEKIGEYISAQYNFIIDKYSVVDLKHKIEELYINVIKPVPKIGSLEFVERTSKSHKLCITSDTFFIRGHTIKEILKKDGFIKYFDALFFSDEIGLGKTKHKQLEYLISKYGFNKKDVVHIGDSINSDGAYSTNLQIQFIHFSSENILYKSNNYTVNSFSQIDSILKTIKK